MKNFQKLFESTMASLGPRGNVKTIEELKKEGYTGPDMSLDISLFEYGLIWKKDEDGYTFIHPTSHGNGYTYGHFNANTDPQSEFNWAKFDQVAQSMGITKEELLSEDLPNLVYDLVTHYGVENVFGSDYSEGFKVFDQNAEDHTDSDETGLQ